MKIVNLEVWVLHRHNSDGEAIISLYKTRQEAVESIYEYVSDNWTYTFGEDDGDDDINDYTNAEAIERYFEYNDGEYYVIEKETVEYTVAELQDEIAKAIGLATHG